MFIQCNVSQKDSKNFITYFILTKILSEVKTHIDEKKKAGKGQFTCIGEIAKKDTTGI